MLPNEGLLHNEKQAVHDIDVYCRERCSEKKRKNQGGKSSAPARAVAFLLRKNKEENPLLARGLGFLLRKNKEDWDEDRWI